MNFYFSNQRKIINSSLLLPLPVSKWLYSFFITFIRKDVRHSYFKKAFQSISKSVIDGDYLEFGVFQGSSFMMSYKLSRKYQLNKMRFFAFDSFAGLPNSEGITYKKDEFNCSYELFMKIITKAESMLIRFCL